VLLGSVRQISIPGAGELAVTDFALALELEEGAVVLALEARIVAVEEVEGAGLVGHIAEGGTGAIGGEATGLFADFVVEGRALQFPGAGETPESLGCKFGEGSFA